ncbi:MAG: nucleoside hydrolase [Armatimonadota bacterium]|nr:nucleoside hydrolase [Armatimonadota bacterium]MDR7506494.1 nucleoside hydrolase [Armatimonadota bacterium]MDR7509859.1 nucleoside hydrolase [Armatimonadota bacterium]MDR7516281.1 nucleoside hydrolase [Armatimonadota bacterium]
MSRKVILDCDPGHDDALAILLAARRLEVLGITTVAGNHSLDKVTLNALKVLELAGLTHIPVARGAPFPLVRPPRYAPEIHGESGLDGAALPEPTRTPVGQHGVDFLIDTVMRTDNVTLVPTGPLTNIALALRKEPRIAQRVSEICLMGGSLTHGNVTAAAEFNIYFDPEAAHAVFSSGIPITMVGLNVTEQVLATPQRRSQVRALGTRVAVVVADLLEAYSRAVERAYGVAGGALHDPLAVAALIDSDVLQCESMHVAVELTGTLTAGRTVCDDRFLRAGRLRDAGVRPGAPPNARVAVAVDVDRFFDLLLASLREYP